MPVLPLNALPVGYRFSPTDAELINHFLSSKITGNQEVVTQIREVDLCKFEPWDLPAMSLIETNDDKWIFFCPKDSKYNNGKQSNRATRAGYWKATGKDRSIKSVNGTTVIGTMKTLAFYTGSAPKGQRTDWVIHEYSATSEGLGGSNPGQLEFDQEVWRHLVDPNLEPLDSPGKIFSPLHLPWYSLCSNDMHLPISNDVGPDHNAVQSPYGTNELYMAVHLSRVLATSDEQTCEDSGSSKNLAVEAAQTQVCRSLQVLATSDEQTCEDSGSSKNLAVEAAQAQFDPEGSSNNSNAVNNADISGPEIKLRTHQPHDQRRVENFGPQGTRRKARKGRFRLSYPSNFRDLSYREENHEAKVVVAKAGEAEEKLSVTADPAAIVDETQDTSLSKSNDVTTLVQEQAWIMKSGSDFPRGGDKEVPSVSWIALPCPHLFGCEPQEVKDMDRKKPNYPDCIPAFKPRSKERRPFIVADIETVLINDVHVPYTAGFLVVKPGDDVGAKPDYSIETYFSEDYQMVILDFEEKSNHMLFDFLERLAVVTAETKIRTW
ncbi:hypothetical protein TEA_029855 [Camellia sinensis var. sinensis]|uniref:NAC domain-containing protein n=1 Tax=Camellia sinensis var. sinensis TaxID=542762 RepID=A0A4S4EVI9_CAMSN|nr:hypothetical protein TEA_029855 [Camellia sinensis var. sinensis]